RDVGSILLGADTVFGKAGFPVAGHSLLAMVCGWRAICRLPRGGGKMDKLIEALAPWPQIQGIAIGMVILAIGYWAIRKGREDKKASETENRSIEELRAQ